MTSSASLAAAVLPFLPADEARRLLPTAAPALIGSSVAVAVLDWVVPSDVVGADAALAAVLVAAAPSATVDVLLSSGESRPEVLSVVAASPRFSVESVTRASQLLSEAQLEPLPSPPGSLSLDGEDLTRLLWESQVPLPGPSLVSVTPGSVEHLEVLRHAADPGLSPQLRVWCLEVAFWPHGPTRRREFLAAASVSSAEILDALLLPQPRPERDRLAAAFEAIDLADTDVMAVFAEALCQTLDPGTRLPLESATVAVATHPGIPRRFSVTAATAVLTAPPSQEAYVVGRYCMTAPLAWLAAVSRCLCELSLDALSQVPVAAHDALVAGVVASIDEVSPEFDEAASAVAEFLVAVAATGPLRDLLRALPPRSVAPLVADVVLRSYGRCHRGRQYLLDALTAEFLQGSFRIGVSPEALCAAIPQMGPASLTAALQRFGKDPDAVAAVRSVLEGADVELLTVPSASKLVAAAAAAMPLGSTLVDLMNAAGGTCAGVCEAFLSGTLTLNPPLPEIVSKLRVPHLVGVAMRSESTSVETASLLLAELEHCDQVSDAATVAVAALSRFPLGVEAMVSALSVLISAGEAYSTLVISYCVAATAADPVAVSNALSQRSPEWPRLLVAAASDLVESKTSVRVLTETCGVVSVWADSPRPELTEWLAVRLPDGAWPFVVEAAPGFTGSFTDLVETAAAATPAR